MLLRVLNRIYELQSNQRPTGEVIFDGENIRDSRRPAHGDYITGRFGRIPVGLWNVTAIGHILALQFEGEKP